MNILFLEGFQKILVVIILLLTVMSVSRKNITSLINTFSIQSFVLSLLIFVLFLEDYHQILLYVALLTLISKCFFIPFFLKRLRKSMKIFVDLEYNIFTPTLSVFVSLIIFVMLFFSLFNIKELLQLSSVNYISMILGISLLLIGMLIIIGRKKIITKSIGYLLMENGVVLMSVFVGDLPFFIEILILMDLLILLVISSILGFGMDSSVEDFHAKLNPFRKWFKKVSEE